MLLKYKVSNYKCIGHKIEFNMLPLESELEYVAVRPLQTVAGEWHVLQRAGLFGPNASGKSAFIQSIVFVRDLVLYGCRNVLGVIDNQPFKGTFEELNDSRFELMLYVDGEVYKYCIVLDSERVWDELLMQLTPEGKFEPLFRRGDIDENGMAKIEIFDAFAAPGTTERNLVEVLKATIKDSQKHHLFLTKLFENGSTKVAPIYHWFAKIKYTFMGPDDCSKNDLRYFRPDLNSNDIDDFVDYMSHALDAFDTGVERVVAGSDLTDVYSFIDAYSPPKDLINELLFLRCGYIRFRDIDYLFSQGRIVSVTFEHKLNDKPVPLSGLDESDGTKRLLKHLSMLYAVIKGDYIYLVDEIDRSLHTKACYQILRDFIKANVDTHSQIIFTAHDTNLINKYQFLQSEIYFIARSHTGESKLKPLTGFNIDTDNDTVRSYLSGRYGAVPFINKRLLQEGFTSRQRSASAECESEEDDPS